VARVPNAPISDEAIRAAFMMGRPKTPFDAVASIKAAPKPKISPRKPPRATLSAYKPTLGERIESGIGSALSGVMGDRYAQHFAGRAMAPLNDFTPVGNATGIADGATDMRQGFTKGNLAQGALGAGIVGLNMLPFAGGVKRKGGSMLRDLMRDEAGAIRAWHGSPHDFDKFSMDKIGTGAGEQAYGHGLYFAENKKVAESYRDRLATLRIDGRPILPGDTYPAMAVRDAGGDVQKALQDTLEMAQQYPERGYEKGIKTLQEWSKSRPKIDTSGGLYEVNIDAEPHDFVDWNSPVPDRLLPMAQERLGDMARFADTTGKLVHKVGTRDAIGGLRDAGFQGLKYKDWHDLPGNWQGTHNYVVFDDSLVSILGKH
jgi:hypothetical protein